MLHRLLLAAAVLALSTGSSLAQPVRRPAAVELPTTRAGAVERMADLLERNYSIPEVGKRYAATLRAHLKAGDYDKPAEVEALGKAITADLQAVNPDLHLKVRPDRESAATASQPATVGAARPRLKGIEEARWIEPGVAYIRFDAFLGEPDEIAGVRSFMEQHLDAKAIIIDARGHHGGGLAEMDVMLPYLFDKTTPLVDMDLAEAVAKERGMPMGASPSLVRVSGPPGIIRREHTVTPHPTENRLKTAKVYYLTSTKTASAAEHLALAFKRTHRAILVGEHTAGANHFGGPEPVGAGLELWLPVGRTLDPDTGKDWEGVGILPDVPVPADQALDTALALARASRDR